VYFQYELSGISSEDRVDSSILFQVMNSFEKWFEGIEGFFETGRNFYSPFRAMKQDVFLPTI
jgi:hypothetical protein